MRSLSTTRFDFKMKWSHQGDKWLWSTLKSFFACFTQILITETWIFFSQTAACYLLGCIPRTACMLSLTMCTDSIPLAPCIDKAPYYVQDSVHAFFLTCAQVTQQVFQMKIIETVFAKTENSKTRRLWKHEIVIYTLHIESILPSAIYFFSNCDRTVWVHGGGYDILTARIFHTALG